MILFGRRFEPAPWSMLLTLAGVVLFVGLGNWQLQRAAYKQAIEDRFEQRLAQEYRLLAGGDDFSDIEYRKLILRGRFDNRRHFLLDNRLHRGRAGYHVLTPLYLNDSDYIILVDRGWAPWGEARQPLPVVPPIEDRAEVRGIASLPSAPAIEFGSVGLSASWPQLIGHVDIEALRRQYDSRLAPFVLWLAPEESGVFVRDWKPVWMPPEKSRAYAVQWFIFAALAVVLFIVLNLRKSE